MSSSPPPTASRGEEHLIRERNCLEEPLTFGAVAQEAERDVALMRRGAMLDQIDALPGAEHHAPALTGIDRLTSVSIDLMWLGMSSGPSSAWA